MCLHNNASYQRIDARKKFVCCSINLGSKLVGGYLICTLSADKRHRGELKMSPDFPHLLYEKTKPVARGQR